MDKGNQITWTGKRQQSGLSLKGLQGRQSVRATFQLPENAIELLGLVAAQFGVKQKSLLDQLVEDVTVLARMVGEDQQVVSGRQRHDRRRKTFVLNKRTLDALDNAARETSLPRDLLLELSIARLQPIVEAERDKFHKRVELLGQMQTLLDNGIGILTTTRQLLGEDDELYQMIARIVELCGQEVESLRKMVEKGGSMQRLSKELDRGETEDMDEQEGLVS